jgi:ubiquinone/menaquinone biosynthesis C-methylase UbiE
MTAPLLDRWAAWIRHRRHGDDPEEIRLTLERLAVVRDRVLANAALEPGATVLDVGTGDGLIAFGALARLGADGHVIFSDISEDLLAETRALAGQLQLLDRCSFVQAAAENLTAIPTASVDVVTTRSVLAYVEPKRAAFAEFARVLKPGGRISLYEPINRHIASEPDHMFFGYDVTPVQELARRVDAAYTARQDVSRDPMFTYDERDLLAYAAEAGFGERHLQLHVDVLPHRPQHWETFARIAPNPLAPTLEEALAETLSPGERTRFIAHLKPRVERGHGTFAVAVAYLWGVKGEPPGSTKE